MFGSLTPLAPLLASALLLACGAGRGADLAPPTATCPPTGVSLQVLGSGGPDAPPGRAQPSYLIRVDGEARLLVDVGPGALMRLTASGADLGQLHAILLTHLQMDHVADLGPLLDAIYRSGRRTPLAIVGPGSGGPHPSTATWLRQLIGPEGLYPHLAELLEPRDGFRLAINDVTHRAGSTQVVFAEPDLEVLALGVTHGDVPTLGYRVQVAGRRVAFTGDQRIDDPRFPVMIEGAEVLVAHLSIPERGAEAQERLHARPSRIGALAQAAKVGRVILGGLTRPVLEQRDESQTHVSDRYPGPVAFAEDLDCFNVPPPVAPEPTSVWR